MDRRTFRAERARREQDPVLEKRLRAVETYLEGTGIPVESAGSAGPGAGSQPDQARIPESQVIFDEDGHDHSGGDQGAPIDHDSLTNVTEDQHHARAHGVLDASDHSDSVDGTVVAGDLIRGNATPKWDRLGVGADGEVLTVVGGLPAWAPSSGGGSTGTGVVRVPFGAWAKGDLSLLSTTPGDELFQAWSKGANDMTPMIPSDDGHLTVIKVSCEKAPTTNGVTFVVYVNGVATALTVTLAAGSDTAVATGSVAVASEDLITVFAFRLGAIGNSNHQAVAVVEGYYDNFTGGAPGVKEGGVAVVTAANQIDFGSGFDVTESPTGEANVALDLSEVVTGDVSFTGNAGTVVKIRGVDIPAPTAGDDGKAVMYDHASGDFVYDTPAGGAAPDIEEGGSVVVAAASAINFGAGFDVTDAGGGQADIAPDLSEVVTGDLSFSGNAATVTRIRGVDIAAPTVDEDALSVIYDHAAGDFVYRDRKPSLVCQARVTLESGVPISVTEQAAKGTVYLTPVTTGALVYLYTGSVWRSFYLPEIALVLASLTSGKNYDLFAFTSSAVPSATDTGTDVLTFGSATGWNTGAWVTVNATGGGLTAGTNYWYRAVTATTGTLHPTLADALANTNIVNLTASITATLTAVSLELSAAWTNNTTRADALTTQNGVRVKSGSTTRRIVGGFRTSGTATTEDTWTKGFIWSENEGCWRRLTKSDNTSHTYNSTTVRQWNATATNQVEYLTGAPARDGLVVLSHASSAGASGRFAHLGYGIDSTTVADYGIYNTVATLMKFSGVDPAVLPFGYHYVAALEYIAVNTCTFDNFQLDVWRWC